MSIPQRLLADAKSTNPYAAIAALKKLADAASVDLRSFQICLPVVYHHFRKPTPPSDWNPSDLPSSVLWSLSAVCLTILNKGLRAAVLKGWALRMKQLTDEWNQILSWMKFHCNEYVDYSTIANPDLREIIEESFDCAVGILSSLALLVARNKNSMAMDDFIKASPGYFSFALRMWTFSLPALNPNPNIFHSASIPLIFLEPRGLWEPEVLRFVTTGSVPTENLVTACLDSIALGCKIIASGDNDYDEDEGLIILKSSIAFLGCISTCATNSADIRAVLDTINRQGSLAIVIQALETVSHMPSNSFAIDVQISAARYINRCLKDEGPAIVLKALSLRLFRAVFPSRFSAEDDGYAYPEDEFQKELALGLFREMLEHIARYLIHPTVLRQVYTAVAKDIDPRGMVKVSKCRNLSNIKLVAWQTFCGQMQEQKKRRGLFKNSKHQLCTSRHCSTRSFLRDVCSCQGCLSAFYCSRECQKADWKSGHKTDCGRLGLLRCSQESPRPIYISTLDLIYLSSSLQTQYREIKHIHDPADGVIMLDYESRNLTRLSREGTVALYAALTVVDRHLFGQMFGRVFGTARTSVCDLITRKELDGLWCDQCTL
ncbi:hypothetical protein C8J56DRAFT_1164350 [Mycena floridula]|nr:hypothetical protein C8J56DRAFT_1164350 [Mycena floridula]